ncbi:MAG TPA: alpha/beta fold hydrolase [Acidobacteriota bacterium]
MTPRHPKRKRRWGRTFSTTLLIFGGIVLCVYVWVVYRVTHPDSIPEALRPEQYLLPYRDVSWVGKDGTQSSGWFIAGQRGAPLIALCHGYGASRTAVLNLATTLRESGYNILLLRMRGHGSSSEACTLGWKEADDLNSGIDAMVLREKVDPLRVGVWGVTCGAFAALKAAEKSDKISAMALDSVYGNPEVFLGQLTRRMLGLDNFWSRRLFGFGLALVVHDSESDLHKDVPLEQLFHISALFLYGLEDSGLDAETRRLYMRAGGKKNIIALPKSRSSILFGSEIKNYDGKILDFFRTALPI